jgi:hypothetical protein
MLKTTPLVIALLFRWRLFDFPLTAPCSPSLQRTPPVVYLGLSMSLLHLACDSASMARFATCQHRLQSIDDLEPQPMNGARPTFEPY